MTQATAEQIQKIARDVGYRASAVARGLVTRKTRTIGVVVTTVTDPWVGRDVLSAIELAAADHGYAVFLADSNADPAREKERRAIVRRKARRWNRGDLLARRCAAHADAIGNDGADRAD
ncbi:MAG: hypothetical protein WDO73_08585 [Ignavibacteriota bacterium]